MRDKVSWDKLPKRNRLPKSHKADKHNGKKEGVGSFSVTSLSIYLFIIGALIGGLMNGSIFRLTMFMGNLMTNITMQVINLLDILIG